MYIPTTIDIPEVMDARAIVSAMASARCGANNSTSDSASTSTMRTSETLYFSAKTSQGSDCSSDVASTVTMCTSETFDSSEALAQKPKPVRKILAFEAKFEEALRNTVEEPVIDLLFSFTRVVKQNNHFDDETTRSPSTIASFTAFLRQAMVDRKSACKELFK
ncbi:hypothetical protein F53441_720 [Fusarium austroafricanum]|uniref:Uncharacterized protein n=1 Tax=Fusarium austroafricanum TaxID=2364996 RepID=A0A8H4KTS7_9HYPO|nr:hypothetical protein F53441_720 [Fusarium austroafricanum]